MTVEECETAYLYLIERIFSRKTRNPFRIGADFLSANGKFDSEVLKTTFIEDISQKPGLDHSTLLRNSEDEQCKVYVVYSYDMHETF